MLLRMTAIVNPLFALYPDPLRSCRIGALGQGVGTSTAARITPIPDPLNALAEGSQAAPRLDGCRHSPLRINWSQQRACPLGAAPAVSVGAWRLLPSMPTLRNADQVLLRT
jgi:hypothetical protein